MARVRDVFDPQPRLQSREDLSGRRALRRSRVGRMSVETIAQTLGGVRARRPRGERSTAATRSPAWGCRRSAPTSRSRRSSLDRDRRRRAGRSDDRGRERCDAARARDASARARHVRAVRRAAIGQRDGRRYARRRLARTAPASLRTPARFRHRFGRGAGRRDDRARGRHGREERLRLRYEPALRRLVRHARGARADQPQDDRRAAGRAHVSLALARRDARTSACAIARLDRRSRRRILDRRASRTGSTATKATTGRLSVLFEGIARPRSNARRATCARRSVAPASPRRGSSTRARANRSSASSTRTPRTSASARSPIASTPFPTMSSSACDALQRSRRAIRTAPRYDRRRDERRHHFSRARSRRARPRDQDRDVRRRAARRASRAPSSIAGAHPKRALLAVWGAQPEAIDRMRALKERFDPGRILNRGRFIGGI